MGYTTTATAAGTTTLTISSNYRQFFTGTLAQTIVLPVTSTLVAGIAYEIENNSTGLLTVNSSGGNLVGTIPAGVCAHAVCIGTTLTTAADWDWDYISTTTITGTGANVLGTSPTITTPTISSLSSAAATALTLQSAGTTAITVDTSQNVGIGVTPTAQYSGIKSLQVGSTTNLFDNGASSKFYHNAYTATSGDDKYLTTGYAQAYLMPSNGQHIWYTSASGTAGNNITFTQAMTLNANGALVLQGGSLSATGVGITFPATQSSSSDANTLDDYEEGTWTPTVSSESGSITSYTSGGFYTKIGNVVNLQFYVNLTNIGTAALDMFLAGLPFQSKTVTGRASVFLVRENNNTGATYQGVVTSNSTNGFIVSLINGSPGYANNNIYTSL
jgi:hypothetical protein